jgi:hypothetical protein
MNRRLDANGTSDTKMTIRMTTEEYQAAVALADYLKTRLSDLVREMLREKRKELIAAGQRPPRRLRGE